MTSLHEKWTNFISGLLSQIQPLTIALCVHINKIYLMLKPAATTTTTAPEPANDDVTIDILKIHEKNTSRIEQIKKVGVKS